MIALYRGISLRSKLTRWFTWSQYSHASWVDPEGWEIEAWADGVCYREEPHSAHTAGTCIDLFDVTLHKRQRAALTDFLIAQLGKKYDWRGNLHFLTRQPEYLADKNHWFCSELIAAAFRVADRPLLARIPDYKIYPGLLSYSPLLRFKKQIVVIDRSPAAVSLSYARETAGPESGHLHSLAALRPICSVFPAICSMVLRCNPRRSTT